MEIEQPTPGSFCFTFKTDQVRAVLTQLKDRSDGVTGQIALYAPLQGQPSVLLTKQRLNLSSGRARELLAKRLGTLCEAPEWNTIIESVCVKALDELQRGEAATRLEGTIPYEGEAFILNPLLYARQPTLLFGPGDSMKSLLALYLGLLLSKGGCENGLACCPHTVLWLDWELTREDTMQRVSALKRGHPDLADHTLIYRRLIRPLAECVEQVATTVAEYQVSVLILDSIGLAAGPELMKESTAISFYTALRHLGLPALCIGHLAKHTEEGKESPFGSVYFYNLARVIFQVKAKKPTEEGPTLVGLYQKKNNLGPYYKPLGFAITYRGDTCTVEQGDLSSEPELERGLPLPERIRALLQDHTARSCPEIATLLGHAEPSIRTVLNRYKGTKWSKTGDEWVVL